MSDSSGKARRVREETFGALLRGARLDLGWKPQTVTARLGEVSPKLVPSWESGRVLPPLVTLAYLVQILNISETSLFDVVDRYQALQYDVVPYS